MKSAAVLVRASVLNAGHDFIPRARQAGNDVPGGWRGERTSNPMFWRWMRYLYKRIKMRGQDWIELKKSALLAEEMNEQLAKDLSAAKTPDDKQMVWASYAADFDELRDQNTQLWTRRIVRLSSEYLVPIPWERRKQNTRTLQMEFSSEDLQALTAAVEEARRLRLEWRMRLWAPTLGLLGVILGAVIAAIFRK